MRGPVLRTALLWVVAVVVATAAGIAAVELATDSVTDPLELVSLPVAPASPTRAPATPVGTPAASPPPAPDGDAATPPDAADTGAATPSDTGGTPDAAPAPSPSDETTPDEEATPGVPTTRTVTSIGGTARFRFTGTGVEIVFATPEQGFRVDVEEGGDEARARFRSDDHESRIEAEYEDGQPVVTVDEDAD